VASVKLAGKDSPGGVRGGPGTSDPGRITYGRIGLKGLIVRAYDVQDDQVVCPDWMSNGFDFGYSVSATMPPDTSKEKFRLMLQDLLEERFQLKFHHASKIFPGYELVVAPGGPRLKEAEAPQSPESPAVAAPTVVNGGKADGKGFPAHVGLIRPRLGTWGTYRGRFRLPLTDFAIHILPMMINESNGAGMGAPLPRVADRTGLTATYEFTLEYNGSDVLQQGGALMQVRQNQEAMNPASLPAGDPAEGDRTGPSIFVALEKQLGLKLRKVKDVSVDMLIVDSANKTPTAN
jgi:uncharacterized protein (TIGR03435 family)